MRVKFELTQRDIDRGVPKDPHNCPLACSIKRKLKGRISVIYGEVYATLPKEMSYEGATLKGSKKLNRIIDLVDAGKKSEVKPTYFTLNVNPKYVK